MAWKKTPDVEIKPHKDKQCLDVDGGIKIVADKILRYAFFDDGAKIAVLFKDKKSATNQIGVNLAIVHLDENIIFFILLDPQPESEEKVELLSNSYLDGDKNIMTVWHNGKNIYAMASGDLNAVGGPFTSEEVWERYEAADYRFTFKGVYEALIRESRHK